MNEQNDKNGYTVRMGDHAEALRKTHRLVLQDRKRLEIDGVEDVVRFDDLSAELSTVCGDLFVEGEGLRIEVFDTARGCVTLTGTIRTVDYFEPKASSLKGDKKHGFFGRR